VEVRSAILATAWLLVLQLRSAEHGAIKTDSKDPAIFWLNVAKNVTYYSLLHNIQQTVHTRYTYSVRNLHVTRSNKYVDNRYI